MATLSNPVFYYNQATQASGNAVGYVGWGGNSSGITGGNCTRIVRYTLTTGANDSASSITIKMFTDSGSGTLKWKEGTSNIATDTDLANMINDEIDLYFIIGTSATEHIKAGRDYVSSGKYTGKAYLDPFYDMSSGSSHSLETLRFHVQLDGNYTIAPNKTYYVWIFPGYAYADGTYGVFRWDDGISSSNFRYQVLLDGVPEGAVYIDTPVAEIANPGPFSDISSWNANQNVTLSLSGTALKVKSNQATSTPGTFTNLVTSVPSGDTVTLTYTVRGSGNVSARLWNVAAGGAVISENSHALTSTFETFTVNGTASNIIDRLYFFMISPTTSSWFELQSVELTCSTTSWKPYQAYIDNGSGWDLYTAYIDNGSSWDPCG